MHLRRVSHPRRVRAHRQPVAAARNSPRVRNHHVAHQRILRIPQRPCEHPAPSILVEAGASTRRRVAAHVAVTKRQLRPCRLIGYRLRLCPRNPRPPQDCGDRGDRKQHPSPFHFESHTRLLLLHCQCHGCCLLDGSAGRGHRYGVRLKRCLRNRKTAAASRHRRHRAKRRQQQHRHRDPPPAPLAR